MIDNFMKPEPLAALRSHLNDEPYYFDNAFEWKKVWHPLDGQVLVTSPVNFGDTGLAGSEYPTDSPFDLFCDAVSAHENQIGKILKRKPGDIKYVASSYIYRAGWGLSWHNDAGPYCGAFAFYIHKKWKANWGGELMILPETRLEAAEADTIDLGYDQGGGFKDPAYCKDGVGTFIMPKPNRIVILSKALLHCVSPVSLKAGENMRFSVAGFFIS